jgi:carbon monoxide dehydrogenase subunit G
MAITIRETFTVQAPVDAVWRFVTDPEKVVRCMPGAELQEAVDERTFLGNVKVKVGAITASYKGRVRFTEVDEHGHTLQMVAEGRDTSGGSAKGTMVGRLRSLPDGQTEVVAEASIDLTGRIMQVGRGMIQGVSQQLFQQFAASTKARLEAASQPDAAAAPSVPAAPTPIRIVPLLFQALLAAIRRFFERFRRRDAGSGRS